MERKALLILHGKQAAHQALREAVMDRREDGWDLAVRVTWEGGDAERYVDEALSLGYRTIVAAGGDGSVRDITQAMMASGKPDLALAIVPWAPPMTSPPRPAYRKILRRPWRCSITPPGRWT